MALDHAAIARRRRPLSSEELDRLRQRLAPGAEHASADALVGGLDTASYRLTLSGNGTSRDYVLRIYRDPRDEGSVAVARELVTLTALSRVGVLAPSPILADPGGELLGEPLIVMSFISGAPLPPGADVRSWSERMADALASIHSVPLDRLPPEFRRGEAPDERAARILAKPPEQPDALWDTVGAALARAAAARTPNAPTLIHGDFWFGNTIWRDGRLAGIIDWDGARIDDPALDVSIARNDIVLFSGPGAAKVFMERYERTRGPLGGLAYWDLLACLSPIKWLAHWVEGYQELGVELPLAQARARLESWVRTLVRPEQAA